MTLKLVSENEEAVEPTPSWLVILEAGQGQYSQDVVIGYPSYSGPLMAFFSTEDEEGRPVFLAPYHRILKITPTIPMEGMLVAN